MPYPSETQLIPHKVVIKHENTVTSNGLQTTSGANEVITLVKDDGTTASTTVNSLSIYAVSAMTIKLDSDTRVIYIPGGQTLKLDDIHIKAFTVVESGASYSYVGGYY